MTVKSFSINENNDIYLDKNGNLAISQGLTATVEICKQYMQTTLGELVLNTDKGLPYFQSVWNGIPNLQQFEAAARAAILSVEGVTQIRSFSFEINGSVLSYTAVIVTVYGQETVQGVSNG